MATTTTSHPMPAQDTLALIGRILIAYLFIPAGIGKLMGFGGTVGYIASVGLPLPEVGAAIAIAVELGLGIAAAAGLQDALDRDRAWQSSPWRPRCSSTSTGRTRRHENDGRSTSTRTSPLQAACLPSQASVPAASASTSADRNTLTHSGAPKHGKHRRRLPFRLRPHPARGASRGGRRGRRAARHRRRRQPARRRLGSCWTRPTPSSSARPPTWAA